MAALAPPHQPLTAPSYPVHHQGAFAECAFPPQQQLGGGVPPAHRPPLPSGPQPAQQHSHSQTHRIGPHSGITHGLQLHMAGAGGGGTLAGTCAGGPVLAPAPAAHAPCGPSQPAPRLPGSSWQVYAQAMQAQAAAAGGNYGPLGARPEVAGGTAPQPWPTLAPHDGCYQLFHPSRGAANPAAATALQPTAVQQQAAAAAVPADAGASRRRTRRRPTARRSLLNLFDAAATCEEACEVSEDSDSELQRARCCMPAGCRSNLVVHV